jgi:hypothetical protein
MKIRLLFLFISILILKSCIFDIFSRSNITTDDLENRYVSLSSLNEWDMVGGTEGWSYKDGVIRSDGGNGWLRSKKEYGNFSIHLQYRVSQGSSGGVFLRAAAEGNPWETGYKATISFEDPPREDVFATGSIYGYVPTKNKPDQSPNLWHTLEIVCKNARIVVVVDSHQTATVDQDELDELKNKSNTGYVGLQAAPIGEGMSIEYRYIEIRDL